MAKKNDRSQYFKSEYMHIGALVAMESVAKNRGVERGVAFILVKPKHESSGEIRFRIVNKEMVREPLGREVEAVEAGTNYFGVAMTKLAVMMALDVDSGSVKSHLKKGETPYRGGLIRFIQDYVIYVGFSGGTEDQDVEIAQAGMKMLLADASL